MGSDEQERTLMVLGEQRMEVSEPGGRQGNNKAIIFAEVSFGVRGTWRGRRVMGLFGGTNFIPQSSVRKLGIEEVICLR